MFRRNLTLAKLGLWIILFGVLMQTALYAFFTPAWEAPDEPSHYLYVAYLARFARPPNPSPIHQTGQFYEGGYVTSMYEWYHLAPGYVWQAIAYRVIEMFDSTLLPTQFPAISPGFARSPIENVYLFVPSRANPFDLPRSHWGILGLRLVSALLVVPLVWAVYRTARLVIDQPAFALAVAGIVGFVPQFNFISATIRNDTVNNLLSALCILALVRLVTKPLQRPEYFAFWLGVLLGVTSLSKANSVFLLPAVGLAFLIAPCATKQRIRMAFITSGVMLVIVTSYFARYAEARAALLYSFTQTEIQPGTWTLAYAIDLLAPVRDMFWARFGWANVHVPTDWIGIATALSLSGVALTLIYGAIQLKRNTLATHHQRQLVILIAIVILNLGMIWRYNLYAYQPQGRFLFPSLAPLGILALWGVWQLCPPSQHRLVSTSLIGLMALFSVCALLLVLVPAYY